MASKKKPTCAALAFKSDVTDAVILKRCYTEWKKRFVLADGSVKANRWAPIYCTRGDTSLSVRLVGKSLILFGELAKCDAPSPTVKWS